MTVLLIVTTGLIACVLIVNRPMKNQSKRPVDVLFVGPSESSKSFETSSESAKLFFDRIEIAQLKADQGQLDDAITNLNAALPYSKFKFTEANFIAAVQQLYPGKSFSVSGIVGQLDTNGKLCQSSIATPKEVGEQYMRAAIATGGFIHKICDDNWSDGLASIATTIGSRIKSFRLKALPITGSIKVTLLGKVVTDWTYDKASNSIVIGNTGDIPPGSKLAISYEANG